MGIMTQVAQHIGQAIIGQIMWREAATSMQCFHSPACPFLHTIHPMVSLRENMGQPDHTYPSQAQPFSIAIGGKVLVQQLRQFHALHLRYQQRDIIDAFGLYAQGFFHAPQLIRILGLRPDLSERSAHTLNNIVKANYQGPMTKEINSMFKWLNRLDHERWIPPALYYFRQNFRQPNLVLHFLKDL